MGPMSFMRKFVTNALPVWTVRQPLARVAWRMLWGNTP